MSLTYHELYIILSAANDWFTNQYEIYGEDDERGFKELTFDLLHEINKSSAMFFKIDEDNPF